MIFKNEVPLILDLGFPKVSLESLDKYLQLLISSNEELNLISRQMTTTELVRNHVIDCLLPLSFLPKNLNKVADFGSGGGLPAVIYALALPQVQFHLFEKSPRKQDFLKKCAMIAKNLHIESQIPIQFSGYDLVTARAFKPLDVILDVSRKYFESGGKYFLLKARLEKISEEVRDSQKKFKSLQADQIQIHKLHSPVLEVERNLLLINFPK